MEDQSIFRVLRIRPFFFLWISQAFSQIAFNMLNFVFVIQAYALTSSNTAVSVLILTFVLPQLIISFFAGAFVDRLEKKNVMLITNLLRAVCLIPLIFLQPNMILLYVLAFIISGTTQFFLPAEFSFIPTLVKKKYLLPANSLFTGTLYGSIIIGFLLAGPSLKFFGKTSTFLILAMLFVAAAVSNMMLPGGGLSGKAYLFAKGKSSSFLKILFNDIGEVLYTMLRSKHILLATIFLTISQTVILTLGALMPGFAVTIVAIDIEDSSFILLAPAAMGMIVGSFLVARLGQKIRKSRLVLPGVILSGLGLFVLPLFKWLSLGTTLIGVIGLMFLLGIFNAMVIIPSNIIIQERAAAAIRGRIYGIFNGFSAFISIIPVALAGYFSDVFGVGSVLTVLGIIIMLVGILPLFRGREDI